MLLYLLVVFMFFSSSFLEEEFHGQVDRLYNIKYRKPFFLFPLCLDICCRDFAVIYLFNHRIIEWFWLEGTFH